MAPKTVDDLIKSAIVEGVFPGACYTFGRVTGAGLYAQGHFTYCPESPTTTLDTIWDLASVSKVVGTTTAAMILYDRGLLKLDQRVADIFPTFAANGKDQITIRNVLVHDSGLIAFRPYHKTITEPAEVWKAICADTPTYALGTKMIYSDLNMITLQRVLEKLSGEPLDKFLAHEVWQKLGMKDTLYNPGVGNPRVAPTETLEPWRVKLHELRKTPVQIQNFPDAAQYIQGEVHDPTATVLGGVAGHAGLFSTLGDLSRFAVFMLKSGEELIKPDTVKLFTTKQSDKSSRALGWDTKSPEGSSAGAKFGARSFGHTGYTGTCIWIDPDSGIYALLLANRVHPTSANTKIISFRPKFHDAVWDSL